MTQAMKVYQIAESLGMDYDTVVAKIRAFGIPVNNKMSKIEGDVAEQIKSSLLKDKQQDWVEIDLGNGVKKRQRKAAPPPEPVRAKEAAPVGEGAAGAEAQPPVAEARRAPGEQPSHAAPVASEPEAHVARIPTPTPPPASSARESSPSASARTEAPASTPPTVSAPTQSAPPSTTHEATSASVAHEARTPSAPPETAAHPAESERAAAVQAPEVAAASGSDRPAAAAAESESVEASAAGVAQVKSTPSMPPPKTGTMVYDPVTKTVTHVQSNSPLRSRSVQVDPKRLQPESRGPQRTIPGQRPTGPGGRTLPGRRPMARPGGPSRPAPIPTTMGAHKRVVKIEGQIALQELARRMSVKAPEVLLKLLQMGLTGVNINSTLDADTAKIIAQEFQYEVEDVAVDVDEALKAILPEFKDNADDYVGRPPVVTVMGHVDHGKTTLLDAILGMRVAEGEAGGITQKVSAYRIETAKGPVVFFDTPGHEAFTKLRARGAVATDVVVLVIAADDGVMPTTIEAINHVKAANVPIMVALNKMDKPDAKPERVLQQLMQHEVVPEEFGGDALVVKVSAKQRTGINEMLESLALQTDILDLKANPKRPGRGTVFDATLDKGRGVVARVLVRDGTIRAGDVVLAGTAYGKIRAMFDDRGKPITKAGPSSPIEILGLNELPNAGDGIYVIQDLKKAVVFAEERKREAPKGPVNSGFQTLADIERRIAEGEMLTVGVIIKADAQASVEALSQALNELSTEKVKIQIVHTGVGGITESDVNLAVASKFPTTVIGFNVRPQGKASALAESEKVSVRLYNIIYEAVDEMKALMLGQLKPTLIEKALGKAEVRQVFNISKVGQIAGCYVTEGLIKRTAKARLVRDSVQVWEGKLSSLRRFKDDAKEVATGYECGISLENFNDLKPKDVIEAFEMEEVAAKL